MNDVDILLEMSYKEWEQARHLENQRATITNLVLLVAFAALGYISDTGLSIQSLPITIGLIALGIYGAVASEKLYERNQFHIERARFLRRKVYVLRPDAQIGELRDQADTVHESKFPRLSQIRLHHIWLALHLSISFTGVVLAVLSIL